jgi:hypothetical protein
VTDQRGIPLAVRLTGANARDSTMLADMLDAIPSAGGKPAARKDGPTSAMPTRDMITPVAAKLAANAASSRVLPARASRARKSSGGIVG